MSSWRIAAVPFLAASIAGCAAEGTTKGSDAMLGTLMKIIPDASAVAFVHLGPPTKSTVQGRPYVKFPSQVIESLHGLQPGKGSVDVLVPEASAAELGEGGEDAVVFLKAEGPVFRLVRFSEPLEVPQEKRAAFLSCVRAYVAACQPSVSATARRKHLVNMLQSDIAYFQQDASRSALDATGWTDDEVEVLITLVKGDDRHKAVEGLAHDNLVPVAMKAAAVPRAIAFGKEMLKAGEFRTVYLGLVERAPQEAEAIVKAFLDDPEEQIQVNGLLVAGLLRRADLLDAFQNRFKGPPPGPIQVALEQAREFVKREI